MMGVSKALNIILADEYKLLVKTRNFHWNVIGPFFGPLHELFGQQYNTLNSLTDEIAERIRQLKGQSFGSMQQFLAAGRLVEVPAPPTDSAEMIRLVLQDHEALVEDLRKTATKVDTADCVTANIILDWAARHEKMAWFLRSHLESSK